jgi:hypothetical protein
MTRPRVSIAASAVPDLTPTLLGVRPAEEARNRRCGSGGLLKCEVTSNIDQATADAAALVALNQQRKHIYGGAGASAGTGTAGGNRVFDQ